MNASPCNTTDEEAGITEMGVALPWSYPYDVDKGGCPLSESISV